jgi:DNA-binding response OmpR family regulator
VSVQNTLLADIVKRYLTAWGYEYAVMTGREVIANASTLKLVIMDSLESSVDILRQFRNRGGANACVVNIGGKPPSTIADAVSTLVTRNVAPSNIKTELHKLVISTLSIV